MSDVDPDTSGLGQQPGADVGDDGDIPDDPLLDPPGAGAGTADIVGGGGAGMSEAALGGGEGDLGGGGGMGGDFADLDDEGSAA